MAYTKIIVIHNRLDRCLNYIPTMRAQMEISKERSDHGRTMELADVQWQESDGFYHASATYTGKVSNKYDEDHLLGGDDKPSRKWRR